MSNTIDIFFALLRSAIIGTKEKIDLSDANFESLYFLAKHHNLAHIIYYELERRGDLPEGELRESFREQYNVAIFRHAIRAMDIEQIRNILESAHIPFVLLKGAYVMDLYPEPWMRTSSDIDVLIKEDVLSRVEELFIHAGMRREKEDQWDVSFFSRNNYHIELHFTMLEDYTSAKHSKVMQKAWEYFVPIKSGCSELIMRDEMFYFYHIAHMAKHFRNGGNGVRTVLDTWLLNHRVSFDGSKRNELLAEGGLITFDEKAKELSEIWFSKKERDPALSDFENYIINGGLFGTLDSLIRNHTIQNVKRSNRFVFYVKRVFPPYRSLKHSFPILKKCPLLLPACWFARWLRLLKPSVRDRTAREIKAERSTAKGENEQIESLMKELEIW